MAANAGDLEGAKKITPLPPMEIKGNVSASSPDFE
jgi:hypothetical protein